MFTQHIRNYSQNARVNTFAGGVSATIDTPLKLATKMNIDPLIIKNFKVVGANVQCHIGTPYRLISSIFRYHPTLTYFKDMDGWAFGDTNSARCFSDCPELVELYFKNVSHTGEAFAGGNPKLTSLGIPNLTITENQTFNGNPILPYFNAPNWINNIGANYQFGGNLLLTECVAPNINRLSNFHYHNCRKLIQAIHNSATTVYNSAFVNCYDINYIGLKACKTMGSSVFLNIKLNCIIDVNVFLLTSGSGGVPNSSLTYAKTSRNAIVNFYDDAGNYVSTL